MADRTPRSLISCKDAANRRADSSYLFVDCRYDLADRGFGPRSFSEAHIPGAIHADIDRDLSSAVGDGSRGRHPLPEPDDFIAWCEHNGIDNKTRVVAYDDQVGQWASRLWWLLRHYGHKRVEVLDGGLRKWKELGLPLERGESKARKPTRFHGEPRSMPTVTADDLARGDVVLVDVRAPERFRGEVEPIDKQAGHIPGAINAPFAGNVNPDATFRSPGELKARLPTGPFACYCGSGVTSTQTILAAELAGLPTPALYPGSWSEWNFPPAGRPIETGPAR